MIVRRKCSRGVTMVIVLWVVAALTVLVSGLVQAQRSELRVAAASRSALLAAATGQAAIEQAAQALAGRGVPEGRLSRLEFGQDARRVAVEVLPLSGLVDLNSASEALLVALFSHAAAMDEGAARALAAAVVTRRQLSALSGPRRLEALEELLTLPGADPDLLARIAPLVTTDSSGSGKVNALAAPPAVLMILARGNAGLASRIAEERDTGAAAIDTTRLEGGFIDASTSSRYRITAIVPEPDGSRVFVERFVDLRPAEPGGPPWRTLRSILRREPAPRVPA